MSETKPYNGELRQLYNDMDKRIAVLEATNKGIWEQHNLESRAHRSYVHDTFHEIKSNLSTIIARLASLPCEVRIEQTKNVNGHIKALWISISTLVMGVIAMAWKVLWEHRT